MRCCLRTLLLVLALGPPVLAGAIINWRLVAAMFLGLAMTVVYGHFAYVIVISPWLAIRVVQHLNKAARTMW